MRTEKYCSETLYNLLKSQKVAKLSELKKALGTSVRQTVLRKLKELGYKTSYSHGGEYYALEKFIKFDAYGLWSYNNVHFSQYGTLKNTIEKFVRKSEAGFFLQELNNIFNVNTQKTLLELVKAQRLERQKVSTLYLYCSENSNRQKEQVRNRRLLETELILSHGLGTPQVTSQELKAAIILFLSLLDEKQRRLYAGLESLRQGHGGDRKIATLLGMDVHTISKGRHELLEQEIELERVRKKGAGRKSIKKNTRNNIRD